MQIDSPTLEQIANQVLFSTNHQVKRTAEQHLQNFLSQAESNYFAFIFEKHSTNVILAIASYLAFWTESCPNLKKHLDAMNRVLRSCFRPQDCRFIRPNLQQQLEPQIVKTILKFLGKALKVLYMQLQMQKEVINWLQQQQGDEYRLILFSSFIEEVSSFDSTLNFLTYKTILQSFQEDIVPEVIKKLSLSFIRFSQAMDIENLNVLQNNISLDQGTHTRQSPSAINNLVYFMFRLLQKIVSFRYNLKPSDFDKGQMSKSKVSFPQSIIRSIIKQDFLQALYNLLGKLLQLGHITQFQVFLKCLEKIFDARISIIPKDLLPKYIGINIQEIFRLLDCIITRNKGSLSSLEHLVRCITKFQDIFNYCQLGALQQLDNTYQQFYLKLVKLSFRLSLLVLKTNMPLNAQNYLFLGAVAVIRNMDRDIHNLIEQGNVFILLQKQLQKQYKNFFETFLYKFFSGNYQIQGSIEFSTIQTLGKQIKKFYKHLVPACSLVYIQIFTFLNQRLAYMAKEIDHNPLNIANLFFFVTAMINDQDFFDTILHKNKHMLVNKNHSQIKSHPACLISNVMKSLFEFLKSYIIKPKIQPLNHALVMFLEALLIRFSSKLEIITDYNEVNPSTSFKITDTLLEIMLVQVYKTKQKQKYEQIFVLINLMTGLANFIPQTQNKCIQFIMKPLHSIISNLKRFYTLQKYRNTIYPQLLDLLNRLQGLNVNMNTPQWRVNIFKTLALMCYDNALDDYRTNIQSSIQLILSSRSYQKYSTILYDLTGILEGIDSTQVYQYFMGKFLARIKYQDLMSNLFNRFRSHPILLKSFLHLTYLIIRPREGNSIHQKQLYEMISLSFPYWNYVLDNIKDSTDHTQLFEEFYLIMGALIGQKHINLHLLKNHMTKNVEHIQKFIILSIQHFKKLLEHIDKLPQMVIKYYNVVNIFLNKLTSFLYNSQYTEAAKLLTDYLNSLMLKIVNNFDKVVLQEYSIQQLQKQLNLCQLFFSYFISSKPFSHKFATKNHILQLPLMTPDSFSFLGTAFKLGLNIGPAQQQVTLIHILSQLCFDMCQLYNNFQLDKMMKHIGLIKKEDKDEFIKIMTQIRESKATIYQIENFFKDMLRFSDKHNQSSTFDGY